VAGGSVVAFNLHALHPVPGASLRLAPDDPEALRWLWENWGTTWTLRRVELLSDVAQCFAVRFFSAGWPPRPVLRQIQSQWPELTVKVQVDYC
jgi:hypothetical protein